MKRPGGADAKRWVNRAADLALAQFGVSPHRSLDIKRSAWWWLRARGVAAKRRTAFVRGCAIVWTVRQRAELLPVEVPLAGPGEVTIEVVHSVISPGTERAQYLGLPNARVAWNHVPGFAVAGRVISAGDDVRWARAGQWVAAAGVPHQSIATVSATRVHPVPSQVNPVDFAFLHFGLISGQGVRLAEMSHDEPFAVIGLGVIGVLAQRLARDASSGSCVSIATSRRRAALARSDPGDRFLTVSETEQLDALRVPVIFEATGDPTALRLATRVCADGGRIILLGSPRAGRSELSVGEMRRRGLTLIGAHVKTLDRQAERVGPSVRAEVIDRFVRGIACGSVSVEDLVTQVADPREADAVYRRLAADPSFVTARFDWARLGREERVAKGSWFRLPELRARGVAPQRALLPLAQPAHGGDGSPTYQRQVLSPGESVRTLRIGLAGCGEIATLNAAAATTAQGVEVRGYYDPNTALADDLAQRHGGTVSSTYKDLLRRSDIDAILLSVPHHLHGPLSIEALGADKDVIIEKPPCNDLSSLVRVQAAARRSGRTVTVCFPNRYEAEVVSALRLVGAGALGELHGARITLLDDKPASYLHGGFSGRSTSTWRTSKELAGGGVLIMNLVHSLDLLLHLSPLPIDEVYASIASQDWPAEVEDVAALNLRFTNGAIGSVFGAVRVRGFSRQHEEFRLWGSRGHLELAPTPQVYSSRPIDGMRPVRWHGLASSVHVPTRQVFFERFAKARADGKTPDVSLEQAIAVQALMEAAYRSAESGTPASVSEIRSEFAR